MNGLLFLVVINTGLLNTKHLSRVPAGEQLSVYAQLKETLTQVSQDQTAGAINGLAIHSYVYLFCVYGTSFAVRLCTFYLFTANLL